MPYEEEFAVHSPLAGLTGILGPGAHVAVELLTQKSIRVRYFLSRRDLQGRKSWVALNWLIFAGVFAALAAGIFGPFVWMITVVAPICAICSAIIYYVKIRYFRVERANDSCAELLGVPKHVLLEIEKMREVAESSDA